MKKITILTTLLGVLVMVNITCKKDDESKSSQPPTCQITAPANGQQIILGQTVTISANVIDNDDSRKLLKGSRKNLLLQNKNLKH